MLNIFEIRRSNVLRITKFITRKKLATLIGMEYGLLNQYLREKTQKISVLKQLTELRPL